MKPLLTDHHLLRRALRVLSAVGCLLSAGAARAASAPSMLTYAWRAEATRPAEVAVTIRQGETLRLACTLLERSKPIAVPDDATSRFFWRDADAKGNYWAKEATRQGSELAFVWTAACDVGAKRYDFVLSLESPTAGTLYRASGLLIMQSSPGFNPASLQPPDVFAEIVAATQAAILEVAATKVDLQAEANARAEADSALQGALSAEAQDREEADSAITEAVNAQADVLEQHQGYLAALNDNFNGLYNSYTNTVSTLQADLATKAEAEHTHVLADTEGLQAALDAKADESAVLLADPLIVPPPTGTDRANFFGWVGTLADWGLSGDALDLRVVTLTRRNNAGGVTNATFYARIVHVGDSGKIEVLFQSIGAIDWSTIAYNASCSFSLSHIPGAPYPSATERVALYFVTDPAAPAWKSVGTFGLTVQLNAPGGIANEPTSQTTLPGGQAYRPILGWAYTDLAATLEGQLALLDNTKAEATHTHEMGDVSGLETALAAKAALEHTHSQYLTSYTESDPTISAWAKAATKPTYNWTEILNRPTTWDWANLTNKPTAFTPAEHTHSQYLTTESDPTVSAWAKAATKPTYTAAEVGAQPAGKYVTYDTTSHSLDAVSKETSFAGGIRTDSFKTLYGTPFFNTVGNYGFNITGFYRLNGYLTENNPLLEWDVSTQKSKLAVTTVYEGGTSLSQKYAPISHEHTVSAITDFPATWDWANLANKPTTFTPATHNHDGTYLKLTGGTVTGNVTFSGTSNYMEKLEFGGSAGAAGLMTRGISGRTYSNSPGGAKDSLFLNYDGSTIPHSTYWNYGNDASRGVFVCGGAPGGLVVRRIDLETILKDYSPADHTHAIADTTGLQAALDALAPLSSVTCTTNNVTYIWQWDDDAGTFALREK